MFLVEMGVLVVLAQQVRLVVPTVEMEEMEEMEVVLMV